MNITDLTTMSNQALFAILLMALVTVATSIFTFYHWRPLTKQAVCVVCSLVASGAYVLIERDTWHTYVRIVLLVAVGATIFYHLFKPGMQQLSAATTPGPPPKTPPPPPNA